MGGVDVEEVAEELYGLKPAEFVAERDAYVAAARKAKDTAAAKAIRFASACARGVGCEPSGT